MVVPQKKILTLFGTRPEVIKLAPVIQEFESYPDSFETVNVSSGQHTDLLHPFIGLFRIRIDHDLDVMETAQTPSGVCAKVLSSLQRILVQEQPDLILVQGDTTTAFAGALTGFYQGIPVGHVEAGLRSGNDLSPFPEEMNRRLITRLASYHFAATIHNRETLLSEGIPAEKIFVTGNPVVDSLNSIIENNSVSSAVEEIIKKFQDFKLIVLTTHRRESLGELMSANLSVLRKFVERHEEVVLIFPVHPNPSVRKTTKEILSEHPRLILIDPLSYCDFIGLLLHAWLIVSDSGGVQEECPTLKKPLLILRENTERPEVVASGAARLVGGVQIELPSC